MDTSTSSAPEPVTATRANLPCPFCQKWNRVDVSRAKNRPKCGGCGKPLLLDRPFTLHKDSFSRVVAESQVAVLVDFYADWCGPCKMMAPFVDELARMYEGRALVTKLNTDLAPAASQMYGIRGIPTTIVFKNGKEVARQVGAVPLAGLDGLLKPHV